MVDAGGMTPGERLAGIEERLTILERRWTLLAMLLVVDTLLSGGNLVTQALGVIHAAGF